MLEKKYKTAVLTLILASMVASGCSGGTGTTTNGTAAAAPTASSEEPGAPAADASERKETESRSETDDAAGSQAYLELLTGKFHEYVELSQSMTESLESYDFDGAKAAVNDMETVFSAIESASVPEKFAYQHESLCKTLVYERDYVTNCGRFIELSKKGEDLNESDKEELRTIVDAMSNASALFPEVLLDTVKMVRADLDK